MAKAATLKKTAEREAAIAETAFRAGYGAGADSVQREKRNRPFLLEGEALAAFVNGAGEARH